MIFSFIGSWITYSACRQFTTKKKKKKKREKKEKRDLRNIYQNELEKAYFQNVMLYRDFKDLDKKNSF